MGKRTQAAKLAQWRTKADELAAAIIDGGSDCFKLMYSALHLSHPSVYSMAQALVFAEDNPELNAFFLETAVEAATFNKFVLSDTESIYQHQFSIPLLFDVAPATGGILTSVRFEAITEWLKTLLKSKVEGDWGVGIIPVLYRIEDIEKLTPPGIVKRGSVFYEVSRGSFKADVSKDKSFLETLEVGGTYVKEASSPVVMLTGSFYLRDANGGKIGNLLELLSQAPLDLTELTDLCKAAFGEDCSAVGIAPLKEGAKLGKLTVVASEASQLLSGMKNREPSDFAYLSLSSVDDKAVLKLSIVEASARTLRGGLAWEIGSFQSIPLVLSVLRGVLEEYHVDDVFGKEDLCPFGLEVKGPALGELLVPLI